MRFFLIRFPLLLTITLAFAATTTTNESSSFAAPPPKANKAPKAATKGKPAAFDPLPTEKADAAIAGRALLTKDLPKAVSADDKTQLDAAAAELRADKLEAGVAGYRAWAMASVKAMSRDDVLATALWIFREGILSRSEDLANAADRVRFFDERNGAIDDSLALLKGAIITKRPVLVARIVVTTPYVKEGRGDNRVERQISRDNIDAEIRTLEAKAEEIKAERDRARAAFLAMDQKPMQVLAALMKHATDAKVTSPSARM